jgi:predicted AAA+ superfamily ATPase
LYGENVYFYHNGIEVDFFVPETYFAIQVSYSLKDVETRKREVNALLQMSKHIEVKKMMIITKDEEETILESEREIEVVPVWKWLLAK